MTKKLISMLLSIAMVLSVAVVGITGVSAAIDNDGRYVPSESVEETHRIYFLMPESWKSEEFNATEAGAYWWSGSDPCGSLDGTSTGVTWPGYKMQVENAENNIFYLDLPTDVPNIIFKNYLNGGERTEDAETGKVTFEFGEEQFKAAKQTVDVICQYYSEGDDSHYDELLNGKFWAKAQEALDGNDKTFFGKFADNFFEDPDWGISMNFNNMIYVTDPKNVSVSLNGKETYGGEFYFFYGLNEETGMYEYGSLPNYDMAKESGYVHEFGGVTTPDESKESNVIKFDVKKSGWNNVRTVYCHVWAADGTGYWPAWQTKKEKCKYDSSTGIATYDLSKTGNDIKKSDGKLYGVIFSTDTGMQTHTAIMSGKCIGDTLYCTGNMIENPIDSAKRSNEAVWTKNKDCGPQRQITSTGNIVGSSLPEGETDALMLATYLIAYYDDSEKTDKVDGLMKTLKLNANDVMKAVDKRLAQTNNPDAKEIEFAIGKILSKLKLNKYELVLGLNQTYTLKVTLNTYLGETEVDNVKWFSSDRSVATVDSKGKITAKKVGKATVRVQDSDGRVAECKVTVVKTLSIPSISKLENTTGGIKLSWNKVSGAYGYRVYQKTSNGWKRIKDTTSTSFTDSAVSANQTKTYTIRCIDSSGNTISGFNSKGWSKKYTPVAPTISKLENTSSGIKLSWNKITGVYGYRLYYKTSSGGWKRFKDTTATSFTDSGVSPNRTETYTIRCIDKNGKTVSGFYSKGWSKKYTPVAPTISKLENTSRGIKLNWNKITGVYGYRVYQKTSNGWKRIKDTTSTSFTDSAVSANQTKTYTIRCIDKKGNTISGFNSKGWSKKYTATTPKITKLTNTSKGVSVTWNKVTGVYGYRLYRKYAGGSWTRVKDTTSTSFTDSGAKKGKKVTYTVRCIDKKGNTISDYNKTGWSITRK